MWCVTVFVFRLQFLDYYYYNVAHRTTNSKVENTCTDTHNLDMVDTGTIEPNPTVL